LRRPGSKKTSIFLIFRLRGGHIGFLLASSLVTFSDYINNNNKQPRQNNMAKALSKAQIAALVADKAQLTKKQAVEILDHIAALAYKHAKDTFTLPGIGKLVLKNRAARIGRNPKTGEQIQIKAKRVVKFRVAKAAKDAILGTK
jgi:DNA-binding protein HU-beta